MAMTLTEKAAYIKGLAEGLGLDESKPETKIINALIDVIDDLSLAVSDLEDELVLVGGLFHEGASGRDVFPYHQCGEFVLRLMADDVSRFLCGHLDVCVGSCIGVCRYQSDCQFAQCT